MLNGVQHNSEEVDGDGCWFTAGAFRSLQEGKASVLLVGKRHPISTLRFLLPRKDKGREVLVNGILGGDGCLW